MTVEPVRRPVCHPPHRAQLAEDPSVIPAAVEELLRYSGFHTLTRQVARDCSFAGVDLRSGDRVLLSMGAANHIRGSGKLAGDGVGRGERTEGDGREHRGKLSHQQDPALVHAVG